MIKIKYLSNKKIKKMTVSLIVSISIIAGLVSVNNLNIYGSNIENEIPEIEDEINKNESEIINNENEELNVNKDNDEILDSDSEEDFLNKEKVRDIKSDPDNPSVTIGAVGEVLMHSAVLNGGMTDSGEYDYDYIFDYLRDDISKLDYAIADMEGTLAGEPYTGYPLFSAPDAVAKAIAAAKFDMAVTSNNHMLDRGKDGLIRTIDVLRNQGLETIGGRKSAEEDKFIMKVINGIKVAFSSFSYETIRTDGHKNLNGIPIPKDVEDILDTFSLEEQYIPDDIVKLQTRAKEMKDAGADLVVFFMHWGTEYLDDEDIFAVRYSQALADAGVDLCLNCGPHVIWPVRMIKSSDGNHEMLSFFSLGNIVSDQYYSIGDSNGRCEDGILGVARYEKDQNGNMNLTDAGYIATYCYKVAIGYDMHRNHIIPVEQALENPEKFEISADLGLIQASKDRTATIMSRNTLNGFPLQNFKHLPDSWKKSDNTHTYDPEIDDKKVLPIVRNAEGVEVQGPFKIE